MTKKIIAVIIGVAIIAIGGWLIFFNKDSLKTESKDLRKNLQSYHIEANMTMYNGEDSRDFTIIVCYQKTDTDHNFRVSIFDKAINQEQIILRNDKGVYVLTPSLNQVHQFKGDWPLNSPKPYLYQTMLATFDGAHKTKKTAEGYLVQSKLSYQHSPHWDNQEIRFTSNLKPLELKITNEVGDLQVVINFTVFETDNKFSEEHFNLNSNMAKARENYTAVTGQLQDLPLYPVNANYNAVFKEAVEVNLDGATIYVINYDGAKPFTIVQRLAKVNEELTVDVVNGQVVEIFNGVGYYANSTLVFSYNGIEYRIGSTSMTVKELVEIANGMDIII